MPTATSSGPRLEVASGAEALKLGSSGPAVVRLQQALKSLGFDPGTSDGNFDQRTLEAVKAVQHKIGLEQTGEFDDKTRQAVLAERAKGEQSKLTTALARIPPPVARPVQNVSEAPAPEHPLMKLFKSPVFWTAALGGIIYYVSRPKTNVTIEGVEVEDPSFEELEEQLPKKPRKTRSKKPKAAKKVEASDASETVIDVTPEKVEATPIDSVEE